METLTVFLLSIALLFAGAFYLFRKARYQPLSGSESFWRPAHDRITRRDQRFMVRLFMVAAAARAIVATLLSATGAIGTLRLSPDSERYHREGMRIAEQMSSGNFNWPNWIDNGWFQFTGLVYHLFGAHAAIIQAVNVLLGALTPVVVYMLVLKVYRLERPARIVAILVALFPSFIYWSSLMLKDPIAIFSMSLLVLSVVALRNRLKFRWLASAALAMALILAVRSYLFFVCAFLIIASYLPVEGKLKGKMLVIMAFATLTVGTVLYAAGYGFLGFSYIADSHYFDLEYINRTRIAISHGGGAFFEESETPLWGESWTSTLKAGLTALYFFFVTLDFTEVGGARQLMALPEVLLVLILLPSFVRGLRYSWQHHRQAALPLAVFAFGLLAVYGSATTNMGAMFRWRMQAMPFVLTFMICGVLVQGRGLLYRLLSKVKL